MRQLVEHLARGWSIKRKLPDTFGSRYIYISPDSALSYLKVNWHQPHTSLFNIVNRHIHPGHNVWDIGANVGVFTIAAAHAAGPEGRIVGVEPDIFLANQLQKSINSNQDLNISLICAAISNKWSIAELLIAERGRSSNSLAEIGHRSQAGGTRYNQYSSTLTLDTLMKEFGQPDFIKIDVEGAENLVLRGATEVLTTCKPKIYIEVGQEQNSEVTEILKQHGYILYDGDSTTHQERIDCSFNTLAVPASSN